MKCRFCPADAIAVFTLDQGCQCYPDETEHGYCGQHVLKARPIGSMELKEVLIQEVWDWLVRWQSGE